MRSYIYKWVECYYFDENDQMEIEYDVREYKTEFFSRLVNFITTDFFPVLSNSASMRKNVVFIFLFDEKDEEKWNKTFKILNRVYKFNKGGCCGDYKYSYSSPPYYYSIEVYIYNKIDFDLIPPELENEVKNAKKFIILEFKTIRDI